MEARGKTVSNRIPTSHGAHKFSFKYLHIFYFSDSFAYELDRRATDGDQNGLFQLTLTIRKPPTREEIDSVKGGVLSGHPWKNIKNIAWSMVQQHLKAANSIFKH